MNEYNLPVVQFGTADSVDFDKKTWTFDMTDDFFVKPGRFAIMTEDEYVKLMKLLKPLVCKDE